MYAIIETGGKQYKVSKNDEIYIEKLNLDEKSKVTFDKVLFVDGQVGAPYVEGANVVGEVVKNGKAKKITIFKYRAKKGYSKKQGHRQPYTKVKITTING